MAFDIGPVVVVPESSLDLDLGGISGSATVAASVTLVGTPFVDSSVPLC